MENKDIAVETNEPKKEFIPKLKFNINLNTKDLWLFSMYHSNKGLQGIFNVVFTVLWLYLLIAQYSELTFARKVLYLVFVMMFSVIQPMLLYLKSANQARSKAIKGGFLLGISDEGLQISKEEASGIFKWEDIFKIIYYPNLIIIYIDVRRAYLIPKRYWKEDKDKLFEILKSNTRG